MNTQSVWARAASCLEGFAGGLCLTLAAAALLTAVEAQAAPSRAAPVAAASAR